MNESAYAEIIRRNLQQAFARDPGHLAACLSARLTPQGIALRVFGTEGLLTAEAACLDDAPDWGPRGVVLSLLACRAHPEPCEPLPWRAFRELPDSMPYVGAFRTHAEAILVPQVGALARAAGAIAGAMDGEVLADPAPGDFGIRLQPVPKIQLTYLFYLPDETFPANATCLFSRNADRFLPTDALADVAEYTSRAMLARCGE
jgi:hypothetical protein